MGAAQVEQANEAAAVACVVDARNKLGEVPVWDVREQALYWVDIEGKLLQRLAPATGEVKRWTMPERIACFALREKGGLIVASSASTLGRLRRICDKAKGSGVGNARGALASDFDAD